MMKLIVKKFRKKILILPALAILLATVGIYGFTASKKPAVDLTLVGRGDISQIVSTTGKVKASEAVDLAFEKNGRVLRVLAKSGDTVGANAALIELDSSNLQSQLLDAQANVDAQKAKLDELKNGSRPEDLQAAETDVKKAEQDLINSYADIIAIANDAYNKAYDAVRKQASDLFINSEESDPLLVFQTKSSQIERDVKTLRVQASKELNGWRDEFLAMPTNPANSELEAELQKSSAHLALIRKFETTALDAVNDSLNLPAAYMATYKASLNIGITNIDAAISSVNSQIQTIASQKIAVQKTQDQLALKHAGASNEAVTAQAAVLKQAEAKAQSIRIDIEKTILRTPISGVVTRQEAKVGEIVAANAAIVSLISESALEIEAYIPEADIAKIKLGNIAEVTLDAFLSDPSHVFNAIVTSINPAETIIDGVPTYKTTFQFEKQSTGVKSGMTANLDITTASVKSAILVPQRSIFRQDNKQFVQLPSKTNSAIPENREVTTGLRGIDGSIEILSGLNDRDEIITYPAISK